MADKNGGYIGNSPSDSSVTIARQAYTSSGITTDFTFRSGYTPGYLDAYLNGVRLIETDDYVATDGTTLSLTTAAQNGDTLELIAYKAFNVSNFTLQTEVGGNFDISNNLIVGGNLDVNGTSELDVLNVAETATFTGAIDANGNLDVDGHTELDNLNVSGVTTTGGLLDINAGAQANTLKVEDLADNRVVIAGTGGELEDDANFTFDGTQLALGVGLTVTGVSTFASAVDINSSIDVNGHTELDDLNVSGVATVASAKISDLNSGRVVIAGTDGELEDSANLTFDGSNLSVGGNISIGGTLTYEDVTNVDSIGIVTAQSGVHIDDSIVHIGDTDTKIRFPAADTITAETGGTERLRITSAGRIGIGTDNPAEILHLNGATTSSLLRFTSGTYGTASTDGSHIGINFGGLEVWHKENNYLRFATNNTERLRITSAGLVGIGTDNPDSLLHIKGTTGKLIVEDTNGAAFIEAKSGGTNSSDDGVGLFKFVNTGYTGASGLQARTASNGSNLELLFMSGQFAEAMRITSDGKVRVPDNGKFTAGAGDDLQIYHDGSNSRIDNATGSLILKNTADDQDIILSTDDGSGNTITYVNCDGSEGSVILNHYGSTKFETTSTGAKVTGALEVTQEYPTIRPTLDLNFAATKTLDRRITFTRDGVGTFIDELGIIRYASNNVPRFDHDPTTGESLGLLIEESRSNSWTYSQPTSDISFGSSATKTFNAATAPNGETEAFRITHNGSAGNSNWRATRAINFNADEMVLSVWAKGNGGNNYFLWSFQNLGGAIVRAGFKLEGDGETSIITDGNGGHTLQIEKYPDGWYRCIIIGNTDSSGSTTQFLYTASNYSESSSISGGSTLLWGFQLEEGAFATSYIPTSGTTVTRAADKAKITGTNFTDFFNQTEGTIKCSYWLGNDTTGLRVFQINDSDNSVIDIVAGSGSGSGGYGYINTGGVAQANGGQSSANDSYRNTLHVTTLAYKENDVAGINIKTGVLTTDTSAALDGAYNRVTFYQGNGETAFLNGRIQQVSYYPKRLPNAQLQGLTQQ